MKYIDEYRSKKLVAEIARRIDNLVSGYSSQIVLMEVCGTHTVSIFRSGLRELLPSNIHLISGPGCPVCVTPNSYLDKAIAYAKKDDTIIVTFGDMLRVPGSCSSLVKERSKGANVEVVYSCLDALDIAYSNPQKKVIFLGIGFETTAHTLAVMLRIAKKKKIRNLFVLIGHKLIPAAMGLLVKQGNLRVDGFICPGHVSAIIGSKPYRFLVKDYHIPCVIAGFEPVDIAQAIFMLVKQIIKKSLAQVEIQYTRCVKPQGNRRAQELMRAVFRVTESDWRGLGNIPASGLRLKDEFSGFDAETNIQVETQKALENKQCICGEVLRAVKTPLDCRLFGKVCRPENPVGACMVSSEGTCAAYYKYER